MLVMDSGATERWRREELQSESGPTRFAGILSERGRLMKDIQHTFAIVRKLEDISRRRRKKRESSEDEDKSDAPKMNNREAKNAKNETGVNSPSPISPSLVVSPGAGNEIVEEMHSMKEQLDGLLKKLEVMEVSAAKSKEKKMKLIENMKTHDGSEAKARPLTAGSEEGTSQEEGGQNDQKMWEPTYVEPVSETLRRAANFLARRFSASRQKADDVEIHVSNDHRNSAQREGISQFITSASQEHAAETDSRIHETSAKEVKQKGASTFGGDFSPNSKTLSSEIISTDHPADQFVAGAAGEGQSEKDPDHNDNNMLRDKQEKIHPEVTAGEAAVEDDLFAEPSYSQYPAPLLSHDDGNMLHEKREKIHPDVLEEEDGFSPTADEDDLFAEPSYSLHPADFPQPSPPPPPPSLPPSPPTSPKPPNQSPKLSSESLLSAKGECCAECGAINKLLKVDPLEEDGLKWCQECWEAFYGDEVPWDDRDRIAKFGI